MEKSYKFRIYPNKTQEKQIKQTFGCCRYVYNYYLNKRKEMYDNNKTTFNFYDCSKHMTGLKKELEWLKAPDKCSLQNTLKNLDAAYKKFFTKKGNYPKLKSKKSNRQSYTTNFINNNIEVFEKHIKLPKLGKVRCRVSKHVQGKILNVTVSKNPAGQYYVSVCCTGVVIKHLNKTNRNVGLDLGVKEFAITSDNEHYTNPKYLQRSLNKLAKLQKSLSRKQIGGQNRDKARVKVARLHEHILNQRNDFLHKTSKSLVEQYDIIVIEDLDVKEMLEKKEQSRNISDVSWSEFARQLEYKCNWYGKELRKIDRYFPSSQLCSRCGFKNSEVKDLSVRKWICPNCGEKHDRDFNAAKNILNEGLKV